jgi:hypothetical protein
MKLRGKFPTDLEELVETFGGVVAFLIFVVIFFISM